MSRRLAASIRRRAGTLCARLESVLERLAEAPARDAPSPGAATHSHDLLPAR